MEQRKRYTLGKEQRLKSRKAIDQLFANGHSFSLFPFRIVYRKNELKAEGPILQAAFSVSKRHFKKAVHRNRIKRLMREAYRLQKNDLQKLLQENGQQLIIFILYTGNALPQHTMVMEKIAAVIKRLQKTAHEDTTANT